MLRWMSEWKRGWAAYLGLRVVLAVASLLAWVAASGAGTHWT
jgi:hypothetical protein